MNRICELRKRSKLTQKALAEKLQIDQSAVSYWECGRAFPDTQKQIMLADIFGVSIDYILGRDTANDTVPASGTVPVQFSRVKQINVYSALTAATYASEAVRPIGHLDIPSDWEGDYYGIIVKGDSMSPRYLDGDTVILRRQSSFESGQDVYVFIGQQEGMLKKISLDYNRSITLKSINQSYRTMFFTEREIDSLPLKVGGVAVELRRKLQ